MLLSYDRIVTSNYVESINSQLKQTCSLGTNIAASMFATYKSILFRIRWNGYEFYEFLL